jgi:hypothetical protein
MARGTAVVDDHRARRAGPAFRAAGGSSSRRLGIAGRRVLMTFGLLGPGKGLEHAMRGHAGRSSRAHPDVIYRIVGATHPNLVAHEGEAYRQRLMARARANLRVEEHVVWDNRFLDLPMTSSTSWKPATSTSRPTPTCSSRPRVR